MQGALRRQVEGSRATRNAERGTGNEKRGLGRNPVPVNLFRHCRPAQAEKLLPQPQPPVALGLLKVNPLPCIDEV